jgi:hypothetical protein
MSKSHQPAKRGAVISDSTLRSITAELSSYPAFEEAPEHNATFQSARTVLMSSLKHVYPIPDRNPARPPRYFIRFMVQGRNIIFGYFDQSNFFSAARYADMVSWKIWQFRHRDALPPTASMLNFGSVALVSQDWETYEGTYGATINKLFSRLESTGRITRDADRFISPKRASELAMEATRTLVTDTRTQILAALAEYKQELFQLRQLVADLKKSQDVLADRLLAADIQHGPAALGLPLGGGEDYAGERLPLRAVIEKFSEQTAIAVRAAKDGEGMGAIGTVDQGNSQDAWA